MTDQRNSLINLTLKIEELTKETLKIAKALHITIFPILYPDAFYNDFFEKRNKKCYLIKSISYIGIFSAVFYSDHVYLMTFGILEQYRRNKIGGCSLVLFERYVVSKGIFKIFLHVQVTNKIACNFYKKQGYKKIKKEENYYESLADKEAYLFYKRMSEENQFNCKIEK